MKLFFNQFIPGLLKELHFHPFPIWQTLHSYNRKTSLKDFKAALTVSALTIPQAMAYALIAGLPPQYGLYAAIAGGFFAALFGNSNHLVCEPTNATAILLASAFLQFQTQIDPLKGVLVITFLVGLFHLIAGFGKFGNLTQYISRSVIIGYTSGAVILIASNQVHYLLGFDINAMSFYDLWANTIINLPKAHFITCAMGGFGIVLMLALRRWKPTFPAILLYLLLCALMAKFFNLEEQGVRVLGEIPASLPPFQLPPIDLYSCRWLLSPALAIALLAMLEANAISKTIAASSGQQLNFNQELLGLGVGNMASSFLGGMPISGSLTRSTMNYQVGAQTRVSTIYCSLIVAAVILFAGPLTRFVPVVSLAAIVIVITTQIVSGRLIHFALHSTKSDAAVFLSTLISTLFMPLDIAIYFGVGISLALFLRQASLPHLVEYSFTEEGNLKEIDSPKKRLHAQVSIIHVEGELFFGAADLFQSQIRRICEEENIKVIILRMKNARHLDATTVMAIDQLLDFLHKNKRYMIISGISSDVSMVLKRSGLLEKIGTKNIFPAEANLNVSTRNALKRALDLIHQPIADIRIFYDKSKETKV